MNLTPQLREHARLSILRFCLTPCATGLVVASLRGEGLRLEREQAELEIEYLRDKGMLRAEPKAISPEVKLWRTTAEGRDYLAQQGQDE